MPPVSVPGAQSRKNNAIPQSDLTPCILTLPKGLINISQEGDLTVISKIDREDSKINNLNGVLWYNVTVFDNADNTNTLEVFKSIINIP